MVSAPSLSRMKWAHHGGRIVRTIQKCIARCVEVTFWMNCLNPQYLGCNESAVAYLFLQEPIRTWTIRLRVSVWCCLALQPVKIGKTEFRHKSRAVEVFPDLWSWRARHRKCFKSDKKYTTATFPWVWDSQHTNVQLADLVRQIKNDFSNAGYRRVDSQLRCQEI